LLQSAELSFAQLLKIVLLKTTNFLSLLYSMFLFMQHTQSRFFSNTPRIHQVDYVDLETTGHGSSKLLIKSV